MSNCKLIFSYTDKYKDDSGLKHEDNKFIELELSKDFNPEDVDSILNLIDSITDSEKNLEAWKDLASLVGLRKDYRDPFTDEMLNKWNKDLKSKFGDKNFRYIGSDTLENSARSIPSFEHFAKVLDKVVPRWKERNVVITQNKSIEGHYGYSYFRNKSGQELEVVHSGNIKNYLQYLIISTLVKDGKLLSEANVQLAINDYKNDKRTIILEFMDLEISLEDNEVYESIKKKNKKTRTEEELLFFEKILTVKKLQKKKGSELETEIKYQLKELDEFVENIKDESGLIDIDKLLKYYFFSSEKVKYIKRLIPDIHSLITNELVKQGIYSYEEINPHIIKFSQEVKNGVLSVNKFEEFIKELNKSENLHLETILDLLTYINNQGKLYYYSLVWYDDKNFVLRSSGKYRYGTKQLKESIANFAKVTPLRNTYCGQNTIRHYTYRGYTIVGVPRNGGYIYYASDKSVQHTVEFTGSLHSGSEDYIKNQIDKRVDNYLLEVQNRDKIKLKILDKTKNKTFSLNNLQGVYNNNDLIRILDIDLSKYVASDNGIAEINSLLKLGGRKIKVKDFNELVENNEFWSKIQSILSEPYATLFDSLEKIDTFNYYLAYLIDLGLTQDNVELYEKEISEMAEKISNAKESVFKTRGQVTSKDIYRISIKFKGNKYRRSISILIPKYENLEPTVEWNKESVTLKFGDLKEKYTFELLSSLPNISEETARLLKNKDLEIEKIELSGISSRSATVFESADIENEILGLPKINMKPLMVELKDHLQKHFGLKVNLYTTEEIKSNPKLNKIPNITRKRAFIFEGEICINVNKAKPSDFLHEFMHLILGLIRATNPRLYSEIVSKSVSLGEIYTRLLNDNRSVEDIQEEIFVEKFSRYITNYIPALSATDEESLEKLKALLPNAVEKTFMLKLDCVSGLEDISKMTIEDLFNMFGSYMLIETNNELKNFIHGESGLTLRKITNIISELKRKSFIVQEIIRDDDDNIIEVRYHEQKRVTVEKENKKGELKKVFVFKDTGVSYSELELREKIAKHIVAVRLWLKDKEKSDKPILVTSDVKLDVNYFNDLSNFSDVVFSDEESVQQNVVAKLTPLMRHNIASSKAAIDSMENALTEEVVIKSGYISLYSYLDRVGENGNNFITPFKLEELKAARTLQYRTEHKEEDEIEILIKSEVEGFIQSAKIGYDVHKAANMFFKWMNNGNITRQLFYSILSSGYSDETGSYNFETLHANADCINSLYDSLVAIREKIYLMFPDCKIIPNIQLVTQLTDDSKKLVANLDLIVVEKSGNVNVLKFKSSGHLYGQLDSKILDRDDYHLGFIRQMLAKEGIPAERMGLYTIGLNVAKDLDGNPYRISFEKIDNRLIEKNVSGQYNRLTWKTGEFSRNIDKKIEVGLADSEITIPFKEEVVQLLTSAFPRVVLHIQELDKDVDNFINSKRVMPSDDPNYTYMFIDYTKHKDSPDRKIYIKNSDSLLSNIELRLKVKEQLQRESDSRKQETDNFVNNLLKVFNKEMSISELLVDSPLSQERMTVIFSKYLTGNWKFVRDEALADFGIYLLENKDENVVDIIDFSPFNGDLNEQLDFGLGNSIVGNFLNDYEEGENDKLLRASRGNVELMKIMFILSLPQVAAKFNGNIKIGQMRVINYRTGISTIADNSTIGNTFNLLTKELSKIGVLVKNGLSSILFANPYEIFRNHVYGLMNIDGLGLHVDSLYAILERQNPTTLLEMKKELLKIELLMRTNKSWKALLSDSPENLAKSTDPVVLLYVLLWKCIWLCDGDFRQIEKLPKYSGTWKDKTLLNGTRVNMPGTEPDDNLKKSTVLARNAMDRITKRLTEWYHPYRNKVVLKLWKGAGYTSALNAIIGNLNKLYSNMFVRNSDGKLNDWLLLKDPSDSSLQPYEREFLEDFLWQVNSIRFNLTSKTDSKIPELKRSKKWYWLPLIEADTSSKLQQGVVNRITKSIKELSLKLKQFEKTGMDDTLYSEESFNTLRAGITNYEMFNLFTISESSEESRRALLDTIDDPSIWEQNLETVLTKYMFASIRKLEFDRMLPLIKGLRILGQSYFLNTGHTDPNYLKEQSNEFDAFLKDYVESNIYNKSILNDETKYLSKFVSLVKFYASTLALGLNFVGGIRECLEGAWKTVGRIQSQWYSPSKRFTKTEWLKAIGIIIVDAPDFVLRVTLLEAICLRYRIANIDMNALADRIKSNKAGIMNARERLLFWFQTAPDYFTRMGMLLALMIHEGVFEALGYDENGLTYDWKKDKRFLDYAKGSGPKYYEQRGEFLSRIALYNDAHGTSLTEKDGLPEPYTQDEIRALKQFSDLTFGAYDHDTKMLVEKMFLGSLVFLFKTYLSATKTMYFLKPGRYNQGERQLVRDDKGNLLYWHKTEDGKNYVSSEPGEEPFTWNTDSFMKGIVWSLEDAFNTFKEKGISGITERLSNDKVMKSNLILFSYNMLIWLMLGALISYLIKLWALNRKENSVGEEITFGKIMRDEAFNVFLKSVIGSFTDFNILNSFVGNITDAEPASIAILNTFFYSTGETLFGDRSLSSWFKTNSGLYRSLQGIGDNLVELYKQND